MDVRHANGAQAEPTVQRLARGKVTNLRRCVGTVLVAVIGAGTMVAVAPSPADAAYVRPCALYKPGNADIWSSTAPLNAFPTRKYVHTQFKVTCDSSHRLQWEAKLMEDDGALPDDVMARWKWTSVNGGSPVTYHLTRPNKVKCDGANEPGNEEIRFEVRIRTIRSDGSVIATSGWEKGPTVVASGC